MRRFIFSVLLVFVSGMYLNAEVIFLRSGEIVIGRITGAGVGSITVMSFNQERTIPSKDVLRTAMNLDEVKDLTMMVILKDGTNIVGKPVDFDEELGFFVDIGFGNLAVPVGAIQMIADPVKLKQYRGNAVNFAGLFLLNVPLYSAYGLSYGGSLGTELRLGELRELFINPVISFYHLDYTSNDKIDFYNTSLSLNLLYKVYAFGEILPAVEFIVPYLGLGVGGTLVTIIDNRPEAAVQQNGLLTFSFQGLAGLEWRFPFSLSLKTGAMLEGILQQDGVFLNFAAQAGLGYGF